MAKVINRRLILNVIIAAFTLFLQFDSSILDGDFAFFPLFPLGFTVVISMFTSELGAFVCGMIMGIFVDSSSSVHFSFNTIFYALIAVTVSLLVRYLFNNNVRSCVVISFFAAIFLLTVRYLVSFPLPGFNNVFKHFLKDIVPSSILTVIFSVVLFYIEKKIFKTLR
ncbi:MAG: hypothetical protein J5766_02415 [Clostridia bacterium]|nr:hypothetical protein [Clostridia bacterium]